MSSKQCCYIASHLASTVKDYLNVSITFRCRNILTFAFTKASCKYAPHPPWIISFQVIFNGNAVWLTLLESKYTKVLKLKND